MKSRKIRIPGEQKRNPRRECYDAICDFCWDGDVEKLVGFARRMFIRFCVGCGRTNKKPVAAHRVIDDTLVVQLRADCRRVRGLVQDHADKVKKPPSKFGPPRQNNLEKWQRELAELSKRLRLREMMFE